MLEEAAYNLGVHLSKSIMAADRPSDKQAGRNANIESIVHVRTGQGNNERENMIKYLNKSTLSLDGTTSSRFFKLTIS